MPPYCFGKFVCSEGQKLTCKYADLCQMKQIAQQHQILSL